MPRYQLSPEIQHYKNMKRFSVDDLRRHSAFINYNNSGPNVERYLKQQQMNYYNDYSEHCTNSDYSHHSSSNYSNSPGKRFINPNNFSPQMSSQPCLTQMNRRNSNDPGVINLMRDLIGSQGGHNSKSARNSIDFTNVLTFNQPYRTPNGLIIDDKYILENVLLLLKDQNGCRLIQKKLEEKQEYVFPIFEAIQGHVFEIINDQFGNYVIQKIVDYIYNDKVLISRFFELIKPNIFIISINQYGTRVLQRILDYFCTSYPATQAINDAMKELIVNYTGELIMDTNGNHVFQKILMIYPKYDNTFIYDELAHLAIDIAKSKKGGCIFQRAFEFANLSQKVNYKRLIF
jgi:hypothetical protein